MAPLAARADDVAASPAPYVPQINSLTVADFGQSLWSIDGTNQLIIRASDGKTEFYRGKLPPCDTRHLEILNDGSFIINQGAPQWFEPPQKGQPLKLRRAFEGPQEVAIRQIDERPRGTPIPRELIRKAAGSRSLGDFSISPDQKRVACAVSNSSSYGGIITNGPTTEIIRVWNLESGIIESEQKFVTRRIILTFQPREENAKSVPNREESSLSELTDKNGTPYIRDSSRAQLAWADNQTLVIAHDLSIMRFDAATGKSISEWKPEDTPDALMNGLATAVATARARSIEALFASSWVRMLSPERKLMIERESAIKREPIGEKWSGTFSVAEQKLLALSDNGTQLLVLDKSNLLTLWDSTTGGAEILGAFSGFAPSRAKFSPDGETVAAWSNNTARIWRIREETVTTLTGIQNGQFAFGKEQMAISQGSDQVWVFADIFPSELESRGEPARWEKLRESANSNDAKSKVSFLPASVKVQSSTYSGWTLWSLGEAGEFKIRSFDDKVLFEEKLPAQGREFRFYDNGSFLVLSSWGDVFWYEQPVKGQPLKLKREFVRPEPYRYHSKKFSQKEMDEMYRHKYGVQEDGVSWALSRDGDMLAASTVFDPRHEQERRRQLFTQNLGVASITSPYIHPVATVSVWNLVTGKLVSQQVFSHPRILDTSVDLSKFGITSSGARPRLYPPFTLPDEEAPARLALPTLAIKLSWSDSETLDIYDGTTNTSVRLPPAN